ncbi:DUF6194 family protein [Polymorphospora lycopeni]|uniref:DUF6194 family protein n=1 Tax=Polymorphospora lycopeni TaxID=3140240 RepID=A0ABV5CLR8_9ACTN
MATDLRSFLESRTRPVELLALGEPTHGEPAFPRLRNGAVKVLAELGFRSVAVESDRVAALAVDAYVRGAGGTIDDVLADGFTHGLGACAATRELVEWMRTYNGSVPAAERLAFHGFDPPLEMTHAVGPGPYLRHLCDYLVNHLGTEPLPAGVDDLERLLGDDTRWSDPAALMEAAKSIGRSEAAGTLRILTDDLLTALYAHAPRLVAASTRDDWRCARLHGTTALGLLRYHAVAADPAPAADRTSRLLAVRDALMAENLLDIRTTEQGRGPTLVFANNRHLQRHPSRWRLADMDLEWSSAGSIVSALRGDRYAVVLGSLGASVALGLDAPAEDTYEGRIGAATGQGPLFAAAPLAALVEGARVRTDVTPEQGYFPLDAETVSHCDAVWHVERFSPAAAALAARILELPDVAETRAGPDLGAPELGWDDRFFFAGPDRHRPFATIVAHDIPGFDDRSRLDRAGVFRLNIEAGRDEFRRLFGYGPEQFTEHRDAIDFTAVDVIVPHPAYAVQGWVSVSNPGPGTWAEVERLLAYAHRRSAERKRRP